MGNPKLPASSSLDIEAFSRVFRNRNSSYKFLWIQAILRAVESGSRNGNIISMRLLVAHMLDLARYPLHKFRLAFGLNDRIGALFHELGEMRAWEDMQDNIFECDIVGRAGDIPDFVSRKLVEYVPYRILASFFPGNNLAKFSKGARHEKIAALAQRHFNSPRPLLYRFHSKGESIELHPRWHAYLKENLPIVEAWAKLHWAAYLQACNPGVPAILSKLEKPELRAALSREREFWRWVIGRRSGEVNCIFSGEELTGDDFALDHYIPRDFIAHDQVWNLSPISKQANARKSNRLPPEASFGKFVEVQHIGLATWHSTKPARYRKLMESFLAGLKVSLWEESPPTPEALRAAYSQVTLPLWHLAKNNGFETWQTLP